MELMELLTPIFVVGLVITYFCMPVETSWPSRDLQERFLQYH